MTDRNTKAEPPTRPGIKLRAEAKLGLLDDLELVGYDGHGSEHFLHVSGRLIEAKGLSGSAGQSGVLRNVLDMIRRFDSDEIPGARLRARFRGEEHELFTDGEGYFQLNLYPDAALEPGWHEVELELVESVKPEAAARATARAFVPAADAEFAIISDLDDTVVQTGATDLTTELRTVLGKGAAERTPFAGVAAFYEALVKGPDDRGVNPVFYLSRSGWNLYDLFIEFFELHGIPRGPVFLQDLAIREEKSAAIGSQHHKLDRVRRLLREYPRLPFVLIGDSGQHDPETYRRIVHENPGRVRAIYIRDVSRDRRDAEVEEIAEAMGSRRVAMLHGTDSLAMAEHAAAHGLISGDSLAGIRDAAEYEASEDVL